MTTCMHVKNGVRCTRRAVRSHYGAPYCSLHEAEHAGRYVVNVRPRMMDKWQYVIAYDNAEGAIAMAEALFAAGNYDALVWDNDTKGWYQA